MVVLVNALEKFFVDGASNPGALHRFNLCMPEYGFSVEAEAESLESKISAGFSEWKASQEQGSQGNVATLMRSARLLQGFLDMKYANKVEQKVAFLIQIRDIAFQDNAPLSVQIKMFQLMEKILRKKLPPTALGDSNQQFQADWRAPLAPLRRHHLRPSATPPTCAAPLEAQHRKALVAAAYRLRRCHAPRGAAAAAREVWAEFAPEARELGLRTCFRGAALLVLFLPSEHDLYPGLLPEWFRLWAAVDACPEWGACWSTLVCRARKHTAPGDWAPHLEEIFAQAQYALRLPVGKGGLPRARKFPAVYKQLVEDALGPADSVRLRKAAKLCVFALGHGERAPLALPSGPEDALEDCDVSRGTRLLLQLLKTCETYLHPSNHGAHAPGLALFVGWVAAALCRRVGAQWGVPSDDGRGGLAGGHLPITKEEGLAVARALLPLAQRMLYSKAPSVADVGQRTLKHLCCLAPTVMAGPVLDGLGAALDPAAVNQTHQLVPALQALGAVARPLLWPTPLLATRLPALLELALPGLDANDPKKTMATLGFFHNVFNWVPITGDGAAGEDAGTAAAAAADGVGGEVPWAFLDDPPAPGSEADEEAREALARASRHAGGWAAAALGRLFHLVEHLEAPSKGKTGNPLMDRMASHAEMAILFTLNRFVESLFSQMDDEVYGRATRQLADFLRARCFPEAVKRVALIAEAWAGARPSAEGRAGGLRVVVPVLLDGLPGTGAASERPSREVVYRVRILGAVLSVAGEGALPYAPAVAAVLGACAAHGDKAVRKAGRKLLRKTLLGLAEMYSRADRRALGLRARPGAPQPALTPGQMLWHVPSAEEIGFAASLFDKFVSETIANLEGDMKAGGAAAGGGGGDHRARAERWRGGLKTVLYALRGGSALLQEDQGAGAPAPAFCSGYVGARTLQGRRQHIVDFLARATAFLAGDPAFEGDVKTLKAVTEVTGFVLTKRGAMATRAKLGIMFLKHQKKRHLNQVHEGARAALLAAAAAAGGGGGPLRPRPALPAHPALQGGARSPAYAAERLQYQHLLRLQEAALAAPHALKGTPLARAYEAAMGALAALGCGSGYAAARAAAQDQFEAAAACFPWVPKERLTAEMVARLCTPGTTHEAATGAVHFLSQKRWIRHLSGRPDQVAPFVRALCDSHLMVAALPSDRRPKMTTRLQNLFLKFVANWQLVGLHTEADRAAHAALADGLAASLAAGNLHWRYELTATWCLVALLRPDAAPRPGTAPWLAEALRRDDGQPLQRLALYGVVRLLVLHPAEAAAALPAAFEKNGGGGGGGGRPALMGAFCRALLHNRTRPDGGGGGGGSSEGQSAEAARWSVGVADALKDAGREGRATFPHARRAHASCVFRSQNARAAKALVRALGPAATGELVAAARTLAAGAPGEDRAKAHAAAAEAWAGAARALNRPPPADGWDQDAAAAAAAWGEHLLPALAALAAAASPDQADDLRDALTYAVAKRPLDAIRPLLDLLVTNAVAALEAAAAAANGGGEEGAAAAASSAGGAEARALKLLGGVLDEALAHKPCRLSLAGEAAAAGGHLTKIAAALAPAGALAHPLRVVRDQVAYLLWVAGPSLDRLLALDGLRPLGVHAALGAAAGELLGPPAPTPTPAPAAAAAGTAGAEEEEEEGGGGGGGGGGGEALERGDGDKSKSARACLIETTAAFLYMCTQQDDAAAYAGAAAPLLRVLAEGARDPEPSAQAAAAHALRALAQALVLRAPADAAGPALAAALGEACAHPARSARQAALEAAGCFQAYHRFALPEGAHADLEARVTLALGDARKEVRDLAAYALTTRLAHLEPAALAARAAACREKAASALKKYKIVSKRLKAAEKAGDAAEKADYQAKMAKNAAKHQRAVAGLASCVLACPYAMPAWMPEALVALAAHEGLPMGVGDTVIRAFTDFRRTHQDGWEAHRQRLTRDQLDAVNGILVSPSYYA